MPRRKKPPELASLERKVGKYVGGKLRAWRHKARLSLYDVARSTKISASTISEYERGKYICPADRLRKFALLYNAPLSEFELSEDGLVGDAKQIADLIAEWPTEERSAITAAVLEYIETIKSLKPPKRGREGYGVRESTKGSK